MMPPEGSFAFERMGEPMLWERFQNLRQSRKLMLSFGLLAVSLLLLFVIIYVVLLGKMEDMAVKTNSAAHRQMQDNLEKRIGEFESLLSYCVSDANLNWMMSAPRELDGEAVVRAYRLKEDLPNIALTNSDLLGYYLYSHANGIALSNARVSMRIDLYYDREYKVEGMDYASWKEMMMDGSSEARFLPAQQVSWLGMTDRCILYLCPVVGQTSPRVVGRAAFFIRESAILDFFQEGLKGKASYACLMDEEGVVVAGSGDDSLLANLENAAALEDGTLRTRIAGRDVIVLKSTSGKGFSCLSIIDQQAISAELRDVRMLLYGGMIALVLLGGALSLLLTRQNTRQLREMLDELYGMGYRFQNENELKQLNQLILLQRNINEEYLREIERRQRWTQSMLLERLLDGRKVDPLLLTELEARCPCHSVMCVYLELYAEGAAFDTYATQQRLAANLDALSDSVPYYRTLSERRIQLVYLNRDGAPTVEFFRKLAEQSALAGARILTFVGPAVESYLDLSISARNAQREIMLYDPESGSDVVLCRKCPETELEMVYTQDMERNLMQCCLQGDGEEGLQLLEKIQRAAIEKGVASQLTTQMLVTNIVNTLLKIMNDLPGEIDKERMDWVMRKSVEMVQSPSLGNLFDFARRCVEIFAAHCGRIKSENAIRRVREINDYVQQTFSNPDLRLMVVADRFGLTERYLSEFYKRNTGVNLSNYIEKVRMDRAQQLLQEGMPVQDTAQQVGYINVNTFRRAYRRQFGVNPSKEA